MDKTANQIDASVYALVLRKLKHILVNGYYGMDEVRYQYEWDDSQKGTASRNLRQVA
ncbi:hypothetical protein JNJ66_02240 [Candidatus Saccharibacteria bacterium]|nr:hypothetical protein [Candidatus Saccharibacteria bacterium]